MKADILNNVPNIGDVIVRAYYNKDSSLYLGKITGETKSGNLRIIEYRIRPQGNLGPGYKTHITGDFLIINVQLP